MSNTDVSGYPLPSYAATIWLAGDTICLALPSGEAGKSHTVRVPVAKCQIETGDGGVPLASQRGWLIILDILKSRQQLRQAPKLATATAPVQYDIEKMLVGMKATRFNEQGKQEASYDALFGEND